MMVWKRLSSSEPSAPQFKSLRSLLVLSLLVRRQAKSARNDGTLVIKIRERALASLKKFHRTESCEKSDAVHQKNFSLFHHPSHENMREIVKASAGKPEGPCSVRQSCNLLTTRSRKVLRVINFWQKSIWMSLKLSFGCHANSTRLEKSYAGIHSSQWMRVLKNISRVIHEKCKRQKEHAACCSFIWWNDKWREICRRARLSALTLYIIRMHGRESLFRFPILTCELFRRTYSGRNWPLELIYDSVGGWWKSAMMRWENVMRVAGEAFFWNITQSFACIEPTHVDHIQLVGSIDIW